LPPAKPIACWAAAAALTGLLPGGEVPDRGCCGGPALRPAAAAAAAAADAGTPEAGFCCGGCWSAEAEGGGG